MLDNQAGSPAAPLSGAPDTAAALIEIWHELLGDVPIGADSNFFALGGDAVLALQMTRLVEQRLGRLVPGAFFQEPTIASLTRLLSQETLSAAAVSAESAPPADMSQERTRRKPWRRLRRISYRTARRLRRLCEQIAFRRSYHQGVAWLRSWGGQPWVQWSLYLPERLLMREFAAALGLADADIAGIMQTSIVGNAILGRLRAILMRQPPDRFGAVLRSSPDPFMRDLGHLRRVRLDAPEMGQILQVTGLEYLRSCQQAGPGTLLASYHSTVVLVGSIELLQLIDKINWLGDRIYRETLSTWVSDPDQTDLSAHGPALRAYHALLTHRGLMQGELGSIVSDELDPQRGIPVQIGDRCWHLRAGLGELAAATGARVLPWSTVLQKDGRIEVRFSPPLAPGDPGWDQAARAEQTARQYGAFLEASWRREPASVEWQKIRQYLACPHAS